MYNLPVMYRLATCYDMVALSTEHYRLSPITEDRTIENVIAEQHSITFPSANNWSVMEWSLKMLGNLLTLHYINNFRAKRVLEVGAGYDKYLDRVLEPDIEYWMIDKDDYYPKEIFDRALQQRTRTNYINGLLGNIKRNFLRITSIL